MYLEGKKRVRFLLSAKQFGNDPTYYISSSEDFPILESPPYTGYLCRLEVQRDDSFLLSLHNQCHLCDNHLGYFHCGRSPSEREVIARIYHYHKTFRPTNVDYRCISVMVPSISKSGKRKIWCPRAFHRANKELSNDTDVNTALTMYREGIAFKFENQKPEWNEKAKSLVIKFQGNNRIAIASTRNFLLCTAWDTTMKKKNNKISLDDEETNEDDEEEEEDEENDEEVEQEMMERIAPLKSNDESIADNASVVSYSSSVSSHTDRDRVNSGTTIQTVNTGRLTIATPQRVPSGEHQNNSGSNSPPNSMANNRSLSNSPPPSFPSPPQQQHLTPHTLRTKSFGNLKAPATPSTPAVGQNQFLPPTSPYLQHLRQSHRTKSESSMDTESTYTTSSHTPSRNTESTRGKKSKKSKKSKDSRVLGMFCFIFYFLDAIYVISLLFFLLSLSEDNEPTLQFGKATQTRYVLDFKFPYSPIQAFGIALSSFAYEQVQHLKKTKEKNKQETTPTPAELKRGVGSETPTPRSGILAAFTSPRKVPTKSLLPTAR
jgi:hypothetical protein